MRGPSMRLVAVAILPALIAAVAACRSRERPPPTPEAVVRELGSAARAGDLARIQKLLDTESRWSLMSIYKDQSKLCGLVRGNYPKERQQYELQRCRLADGARDADALFALWARERGLVGELAKLPPDGKPETVGDRASLESAGRRLALCRDGEGWAYCGLRAELEQLKLKAARDVATIQEYVEAYRGR